MKSILITLLLINISFLNFANNLALPCHGCHISDNTTAKSNITIPKIIGLEEEYFITAFKEYKTKKRINYLMNIISMGYSDKDIKDLAKFFSRKNTNDR